MLVNVQGQSDNSWCGCNRNRTGKEIEGVLFEGNRVRYFNIVVNNWSCTVLAGNMLVKNRRILTSFISLLVKNIGTFNIFICGIQYVNLLG